MGNHSLQPPDPDLKCLLLELQALRLEVRALRRLFDEFASVFLNAKFPHGDGRGDRWPRRRHG
jgi:hypothetical protein